MSRQPDKLRLVLATANPGKVKELRELLATTGVQCIPLFEMPGYPRVEETGRTYLENATLKAHAIASWCGLPALADDSGLEVDLLHGAPGVNSANFAGPQASDSANVAKLLRLMAGASPRQRTARFRCVLVVACPDCKTLLTEGICEGRIALEPRGHQGFGYDPVFIPAGSDKTFAELCPAEKHRFSHRARAAEHLKEQLVPFLQSCGSGTPR